MPRNSSSVAGSMAMAVGIPITGPLPVLVRRNAGSPLHVAAEMLLSRVAVGCSITLAFCLAAAALAIRDAGTRPAEPEPVAVAPVAPVPPSAPPSPSPPPSKITTRTVPCASGDQPELATDGEHVVACWDDDCLAYEAGHVGQPI